MWSAFSSFVLRIFGWKLQGCDPNVVPKKIFVVMPHTSNWDFPLGVLARGAKGFKSNFLIKDQYFKGPSKWLFKRMGGHPVSRSKRTNLVDQVVELFQTNDEFAIAITPEGTRKRNEKLKTGFYHIAQKANIPIIYTKMDYGNKVIDFHAPRFVADTVEEELAFVINHFKGVQAKKPDQFAF